MDNSNMCWVLTAEYNDYNQHGPCMVAIFKSKPTREQIFKSLKTYGGSIYPELVERILSGGGRMDSEYEWFNLEQVKYG